MDEDQKSRTQKKLEDRALQALGEQLVALSPEQLRNMAMEEELLKAVMLARRTKKRGAKRRQMQFIGALMRQIDLEPIRNALENIKLGDLRKARAFKKIERWRDAINEGDEQIVEEILSGYPDAERQRLTQLARNARKEHEAGKGDKCSASLFRYLKEIAGP
jgi:ribosome-associated protein